MSTKNEGHQVSISSAQWIEEFLDVFPSVKKFVTYETKEPGPASKLLPLSPALLGQSPGNSVTKEPGPATKLLTISAAAPLLPVSLVPSGSAIKLLPLSPAPPLLPLSPVPGNLARMSPAPRNLGMVATIGRKLTHPRLVMAATRLIRLLI